MAKRDLTFTSKILLTLLAVKAASDEIFMTPSTFRARGIYGKNYSYNSYRSIIYALERRGWIKFIDKNNQRFLKLTKKGQIETLVTQIYHPNPGKWDGKWRIVMFDIPEGSHQKRDKLRWLLKKQNFHQLQASVYINPHPLSREAIQYLKESKLIQYIQIIKVEEMDEDKDLRKRFKLNV